MACIRVKIDPLVTYIIENTIQHATTEPNKDYSPSEKEDKTVVEVESELKKANHVISRLQQENKEMKKCIDDHHMHQKIPLDGLQISRKGLNVQNNEEHNFHSKLAL
jgi:hypothetical protein